MGRARKPPKPTQEDIDFYEAKAREFLADVADMKRGVEFIRKAEYDQLQAEFTVVSAKLATAEAEVVRLKAKLAKLKPSTKRN